jgi:hypothetical protein
MCEKGTMKPTKNYFKEGGGWGEFDKIICTL